MAGPSGHASATTGLSSTGTAVAANQAGFQLPVGDVAQQAERGLFQEFFGVFFNQKSSEGLYVTSGAAGPLFAVALGLTWLILLYQTYLFARSENKDVYSLAELFKGWLKASIISAAIIISFVMASVATPILFLVAVGVDILVTTARLFYGVTQMIRLRDHPDFEHYRAYVASQLFWLLFGSLMFASIVVLFLLPGLQIIVPLLVFSVSILGATTMGSMLFSILFDLNNNKLRVPAIVISSLLFVAGVIAFVGIFVSLPFTIPVIAQGLLIAAAIGVVGGASTFALNKLFAAHPKVGMAVTSSLLVAAGVTLTVAAIAATGGLAIPAIGIAAMLGAGVFVATTTVFAAAKSLMARFNARAERFYGIDKADSKVEMKDVVVARENADEVRPVIAHRAYIPHYEHYRAMPRADAVANYAKLREGLVRYKQALEGRIKSNSFFETSKFNNKLALAQAALDILEYVGGDKTDMAELYRRKNAELVMDVEGQNPFDVYRQSAHFQQHQAAHVFSGFSGGFQSFKSGEGELKGRFVEIERFVARVMDLDAQAGDGERKLFGQLSQDGRADVAGVGVGPRATVV